MASFILRLWRDALEYQWIWKYSTRFRSQSHCWTILSPLENMLWRISIMPEALMKMLESRLHLGTQTINGKTVQDNLEGAEVYNKDVIRPIKNPVSPAGGTAILRGSLAPNGAVIKPTAAEKRLWKHKGLAVVFKDIRDLKARVDSKDLEVTPDSILVLQNAGPVGGPGMPEWGQLPVPKNCSIRE